MANNLEKELKSLEQSIRKLEKIIPKKEGTNKRMYGKLYRIANDKYMSGSLDSPLFKDKWIRQSRGFVGGEVRGLGESLNNLLEKRKQIYSLLNAEKITNKTVVPEEVRHLFPAGKGALLSPLGGYTNPHYSEAYDEDAFLIQRNKAKKDFYNEYGKKGLFGSNKARKMTSKEKLAIMSENFHPNDPLYSGDKSQAGHLGIRTTKTNFNENDKDGGAVKETLKNNNSNSYSNASSLSISGNTVYGGGGWFGSGTDIRTSTGGSTALTIHKGDDYYVGGKHLKSGDTLGVLTKKQRARYDKDNPHYMN